MIEVLERERTFHLSTEHTSMILHVMESGHVVSLYWGGKVYGKEFSYIVDELKKASYLAWTDGNRNFRLEQYPVLYPVFGNPDLRSPALHLRYEDGSRITNLRYSSYRVLSGKQKIPGLPTVMDRSEDGKESDEATLELVFADRSRGIRLKLLFSVFGKHDAITQSAVLINDSKGSVWVEKVMSACFSFLADEFDCITLTGAWAREFRRTRQSLRQGKFLVDSRRGASGHGQNPFLALTDPGCTEDTGNVYGMNLVYSGSFEASVEVDMQHNTRMMMGIQSFDFSWELHSGEEFYTPEAVLVHSDRGLNGMSQIFHRLYRERLMPPNWAERPRPIAVNNWEATYFDFDRKKLLDLADEAAGIGAELFVLDDGWFGHRNSDGSSLGDWKVNEEKLGGSLKNLGQEMKERGLGFGIWMEPEMVSPDSDLFRAHPDWIIAAPLEEPQVARNQYVLDLSRKCVREFVIEAVAEILEGGVIDYVKWDMNRNITDAFSGELFPGNQKELMHRYMLGLYGILEELTERFPEILFEGCAGGGGRYDPGMLYYMPQIWVSDDTDAIERLRIQDGASLIYPSVSMSCHVSAVPNHQIGRITPLKTRGIVAMQGVLGYEQDLTKCTEKGKKELAEQIGYYKTVRHIMQEGTFYRLRAGENDYAWMHISRDGSEILAGYVQVMAKPNTVPERLQLKGLEEKAWYALEGTDIVRTGSQWIHCGLELDQSMEDYHAVQWGLRRVEMP